MKTLKASTKRRNERQNEDNFLDNSRFKWARRPSLTSESPKTRDSKARFLQ